MKQDIREVVRVQYNKGVINERKRILELIKEWEGTNYGNTDNRVQAMQKLKDKIRDTDVSRIEEKDNGR